MERNQHAEGLEDDFFEQILAGAPEQVVGSMPMGVQGSGGGGDSNMMRLSMGMEMMPPPPLGLNLEQIGFFRHQRFRNDDVDVNNSNATSHNNNTHASSANSGINEREAVSVHMSNLFPAFGHLQSQQLRPQGEVQHPSHLAASPSALTQFQQPYHNQGTAAGVNPSPQPPSVRPRVRARRGQATDPHSIAERQRRERIAERMKALQELVPSCNKTDRAAMLDEIVDYVKFLRLQVKVLSMSRLGGASAVAQLVADVPLSAVEGEGDEGGIDQPWEKWTDDGTEQQVAKLMQEDIGAAMQFLQSKALCIMPVSLASAIFRAHQPDAPSDVKPESNTPL